MNAEEGNDRYMEKCRYSKCLLEIKFPNSKLGIDRKPTSPSRLWRKQEKAAGASAVTGHHLFSGRAPSRPSSHHTTRHAEGTRKRCFRDHYDGNILKKMTFKVKDSTNESLFFRLPNLGRQTSILMDDYFPHIVLVLYSSKILTFSSNQLFGNSLHVW